MSFHSLEKIGRGDYGFIKNFADNLDTCREQAAIYKAARRKAGLPSSGDRARIGRQTCVLDDKREADVLAEQYARQFQSLFASAVSKPPVGNSYAHYRSDQYLRDRGLGGDFDYANYAALSIFGDPKEAIDKIAYIRDAVGYNEVDFNLGFGGMPTDVVRRVMRTLAEKVMPHFR